MKKLLKFLLMHLPIISNLYRRYRSIEDRLYQQKKSIKKLSTINEKQGKSIEVLLAQNTKKDKQIEKLKLKIAEKDKQIKKLSQDIADSNKQLKKQIAEENTANIRRFDNLSTEINSLKTASDAEFEKLSSEMKTAGKAVDEKIRQERIHTDTLNNQLTREVAKNHILMKNSEKDLKARISYKYIQGLHRDNYQKALTEWLYESVGEIGDLDNPRTFNEKIQWLKLHTAEDEIHSILADKYRVRDWIKEKIGEEYLIPLIGAWDNFDDINFDEFPDKFVLKANHGCKYNYIVYDKSKFNVTDARNKFTKWMRENFAWNSLELQYKNIPRKIIAEEYVENSDQNLNDYKIFCFDGKPKYIMFLTDRKESLKMAIFDLDWNLMPFVYNFPQYTGEVEKPAQLQKMIELAGILAEGFPHVRVDFYVLNNGSIKFGEMTFTTSSGFCRWQPAEYNRILGDMIPLPIENQ